MKYFTFFLFLLFSSTIFSQTIIHGYATDANTGEAMIFATVAVYKDDVLITGAEADLKGYFFIDGLEEGTYDIVCSYTGYKDQKKVAINTNLKKASLVNFKMSQGIDLICGSGWSTRDFHPAPFVRIDDTTQGFSFFSREISHMPHRGQ